MCPLTNTSSAKRTLTGFLLRRALFSADINEDLGFWGEGGILPTYPRYQNVGASRMSFPMYAQLLCTHQHVSEDRHGYRVLALPRKRAYEVVTQLHHCAV